MEKEEIGKKIKILRKTRGLTQQQLADKLNVKRATISNYEIGRRSPHIKELEDISQRLEVARLLKNGYNYQTISKETGASTATISRVNKCINYGSGGYKIVLDEGKGGN